MSREEPQKIFTKPILSWWDEFGRKDLPWQKSPSLYKTWISEIMLQQTQVKTVIPYFMNFITAYPNIDTLANAKDSEVMSYWSGLGYYSRARNLHKTARIIQKKYEGRFPQEYEQIIDLPGIGPSTGGAIVSLNKIEPRPIVDGNVKRVISRHFLIKGNLDSGPAKKKVWELSKLCTPNKNFHIYSQAIMDLGATICRPRNPQCSQCPVKQSCIAKKKNIIDEIPQRKLSKPKKKREYYFLIIKNNNQLLLELRDSSGIWPGLWSFPIVDSIEEISKWVNSTLGLSMRSFEAETPFMHSLTHMDLKINPIIINFDNQKIKLSRKEIKYFDKKTIRTLGISKAVKIIIDGL